MARSMLRIFLAVAALVPPILEWESSWSGRRYEAELPLSAVLQCTIAFELFVAFVAWCGWLVWRSARRRRSARSSADSVAIRH